MVERETKTKAYSKEGLGSITKMDPVQKEKEEISNWLSNTIDTLTVQVDQFESEIEALQIGQKKNKKDREKQSKHDKLKKFLESHRYHINQLETILRMLNNETVSVEQVKGIRDMMEYYTECNLDDDLPEFDSFYDDLDIETFRANNLADALNPLAKSSSTSSNSKPDSTSNVSSLGDVGVAGAVGVSTISGTKENDETIVHSFSSSPTHGSPVASPGLANSVHSNSSKTNTTTSNSAPSTATTTTSEFSFTSAANNNNSTSLTSTTATTSVVSTVAVSSIPSSLSKTVWSPVNHSTTANNQTGNNTTVAYPTAATSPASNPGKLLLVETRSRY